MSSVLSAVTVMAGVAAAQTDGATDYGFDWVVIGEPGNRPTYANEVMRLAVMGSLDSVPELGSVGYLYRMTSSEVTVEDWYEFVVAYRSFYLEKNDVSFVVDPGFTGNCIDAFQGVSVRSQCATEEPTDMSWEYAAIYCNWLHNDKVNELWAFEDGAYDVSTFYADQSGFNHHQLTRHPDAKFWIPSLDEWVKAAYFDPDRYGTDIPGYWSYPDGSNTRPVGNLPPESGGERNAGINDSLFDPVYPYPVGTFPGVQSPWGLLDCAGGVGEHTEGIASGDYQAVGAAARASKGTRYFEFLGYDIWGPEEDPFNADRIEFSHSTNIRAALGVGLRIASRAPCCIDYAKPFGAVDESDVAAFIELFYKQIRAADLAEPYGIYDLLDIAEFASVFTAGCQ